ncbi:RRP15-like protein [Calliphora vicina]|uniref:RRP15-like protein n=1 Tax=Calliphora vicina TaxID=7373 RepID=UPI00325C01CD
MALSSLEKRTKTKVLKKQESSGSEQNSSADESSDEQQGGGNVGWADSIAKVLSTTKPKTKKTLVLSRAKKIKSVDKDKVETDYGFEVEGEIKEEKPTDEELETTLKQAKNQKLELRVKPSWKDIERERALRKIATRGVVQLFNAVRIQQKDLQHQLEEAGPLDSRKEAVLNNINKRKFLDVLMSGKRSKSEQVDNVVKDELKEESDSSEDERDDGKKKKSEWNVLRDDFMTNKKIKHWDEEDGSEGEQSNDD